MLLKGVVLLLSIIIGSIIAGLLERKIRFKIRLILIFSGIIGYILSFATEWDVFYTANVLFFTGLFFVPIKELIGYIIDLIFFV